MWNEFIPNKNEFIPNGNVFILWQVFPYCWTSCISFSNNFHTNNPGFNQKITKILIFKNSLLKLLRKMTENDMKMWKLKMTPGVVKPQYLSFYLTKIQNQGQFWNPQNRQISKLTLLLKFGGDLMEILPKNKLSSFFVDTVYFQWNVE